MSIQHYAIDFRLREEGITIVNLLTTLRMCISTSVLAVTQTISIVAPFPQPPTPSSNPKVKEWIKQLQDLRWLLAQLATRVSGVILGIIGGVISWPLNSLSKSAVWPRGIMWDLLVAVGGLLLVAMREWLFV